MRYKYANTLKADLYFYKAHVVSVYDGDTLTARIDLGFDTSVQHKLRLSGIDTPEIRGRDRVQGLKVRDIVRELVLGKDIFVETVQDKQGKYGRYLAVVWYGNGNGNRYYCLNEFLLEENLARPY